MTKSFFIALATSTAVSLVVPAPVAAQHRRDRVAAKQGAPDSAGDSSSGKSGGGSGGRAVGRPAPAAPTPPSGGDANRGATAPNDQNGGSDTRRRSGGTAPKRAAADTSDNGQGADAERGRDGRAATGSAVARRPRSSSGDGGRTTVIVTDRGYYGGGLYPWGYGGLGLGGYYGGLYDPWWYGDNPYDGWGDGYGYGASYQGSLKIKVKPRDASVYVDGYFAGRVDDFDGLFQSLKVESGPHRVEVRADGFETLSFEVRVQPGRTVTYEGALQPRL